MNRRDLMRGAIGLAVAVPIIVSAVPARVRVYKSPTRTVPFNTSDWVYHIRVTNNGDKMARVSLSRANNDFLLAGWNLAPSEYWSWYGRLAREVAEDIVLVSSQPGVHLMMECS